ncbi:unnamed protein product [Candidula unifasciata]|uniref:Receptor ligand binding region domain-containing protein n=1 Tax=Candidula unifasciata TaxID=100452 RepID=A0A8S3ZKZ7_9EUPU|nr:unnamed protein product [Candidula unifasciata]
MAVATKAFFDMMADSHTTTAMLFGDVCYNVTGPIVQIAHQWGMFQLSYADTNPMLSDRDQFPNFYRTVPSDSDFNPARLALLMHFNWTTVGIVFQHAKLGEARHVSSEEQNVIIVFLPLPLSSLVRGNYVVVILFPAVVTTVDFCIPAVKVAS